jgi:hypothetical protein
MTHDYKRNGTTTLFAAMNVLDGTVFGRNMQRHRHQEFIRFLNAVERKVPAGKTNPHGPRQLRPPQASRRAAMAGAPSTLDIPFHADFGLLAQRRRGLFRHPDQAPSQAWRLPIRRPTSRLPSTASSKTTTPARNPSNGSPIPTKSSPPSGVGTKR